MGSRAGKLLPTGTIIDEIDGVPVSCVDVAVPMVIISADSLGKTGYESKTELDSDRKFMNQLEKIRVVAGLKMGLGDVLHSISPKICMVSKARYGGSITSRYFTPFDCHNAHAVSGGLCLAAACLFKGSTAYKQAELVTPEQDDFEQKVLIGHPLGTIWTSIHVDRTGNIPNFPFASFIRTARPLFEGKVFVPHPQTSLKS